MAVSTQPVLNDKKYDLYGQISVNLRKYMAGMLMDFVDLVYQNSTAVLGPSWKPPDTGFETGHLKNHSWFQQVDQILSSTIVQVSFGFDTLLNPPDPYPTGHPKQGQFPSPADYAAAVDARLKFFTNALKVAFNAFNTGVKGKFASQSGLFQSEPGVSPSINYRGNLFD